MKFPFDVDSIDVRERKNGEGQYITAVLLQPTPEQIAEARRLNTMHKAQLALKAVPTQDRAALVKAIFG